MVQLTLFQQLLRSAYGNYSFECKVQICEFRARHPPLSRAKSSHLFLVSFPSHKHSSSPTVSQQSFCCALARGVLSFFPPISSPSSVVALGLGCCKIRVKCSSEEYFSASLMIEWHPVCTAFSSNFLKALMVVSGFPNNFTAALIFVLLYSASTDLMTLPPFFLEM